MDVSRTDQKDIPGLETVSDPFYKIINIAGEKQKDLMKIMIMAIIVFYLPVCEMEQPEGVMQISGFFIIYIIFSSFLSF